MARTQAENFSIRQTVEQLKQSGYPTRQAQAIAFRMFRDGELTITPIKTDKKTKQDQTNMRNDRTANAIYLLYQLVKMI